jgi:MerR family copper efflux transcriptional regulator
MEGKTMPELTIGKVARRAGVGVETVRFYQREGLIEEPPRPESGWRHYPEEVVSRLRFIRRAQDLGFSLKEIDELISLQLDPAADRGDVKARAEAKITEIEEKIRDLSRMKDALVRLSGACSGEGSIQECPILEALDGTTPEGTSH